MVAWTVVITNPNTGQELLRGRYKSIEEFLEPSREVLRQAGCQYYEVSSHNIRSMRSLNTVRTKRYTELARWFTITKELLLPEERAKTRNKSITADTASNDLQLESTLIAPK